MRPDEHAGPSPGQPCRETYGPINRWKRAFRLASSAPRSGVGAGPCGPSRRLAERLAGWSDLSILPRCQPFDSVIGTSLATLSSSPRRTTTSLVGPFDPSSLAAAGFGLRSEPCDPFLVLLRLLVELRFPELRQTAPTANHNQEAGAKSLPYPPEYLSFPQESMRCPPVRPQPVDWAGGPAARISSPPADRSGRHRTASAIRETPARPGSLPGSPTPPTPAGWPGDVCPSGAGSWPPPAR